MPTLDFQSSQIPTPPAAPSAPPAAPAGSEAALQAQLVDLNGQLRALRAEKSAVRSQLESMLQSNPSRPQVQAKDAELGLKIANTEGQVALIQAQLAAKQGTTTPYIAIPPRFNPRIAAQEKMAFTLALVVLIPLTMAIAVRIMRRGSRPSAPAPDSEIGNRLGRLEHAVDTIAIEIERISEGQRFMTKIMAERATQQPAQSAAASEAGADQPMRALGAGPMEPIPVANRQTVRQSVTPH